MNNCYVTNQIPTCGTQRSLNPVGCQVSNVALIGANDEDSPRHRPLGDLDKRSWTSCQLLRASRTDRRLSSEPVPHAANQCCSSRLFADDLRSQSPGSCNSTISPCEHGNWAFHSMGGPSSGRRKSALSLETSRAAGSSSTGQPAPHAAIAARSHSEWRFSRTESPTSCGRYTGARGGRRRRIYLTENDHHPRYEHMFYLTSSR